MIRYCYIHRGIFGIKRPWFNFSKTHGICPKCFPGELKKIEAYQGNGVDPRKKVEPEA